MPTSAPAELHFPRRRKERKTTAHALFLEASCPTRVGSSVISSVNYLPDRLMKWCWLVWRIHPPSLPRRCLRPVVLHVTHQAFIIHERAVKISLSGNTGKAIFMGFSVHNDFPQDAVGNAELKNSLFTRHPHSYGACGGSVEKKKLSPETADQFR